ncbi:MAG: hypothetical protein NTW26_08880 [bacterium]|nr:hypothetical protein [bacterium]
MRKLPAILIASTPLVAAAHISLSPTYEDSGFVFWATCLVITFFYVFGRVSSYFKRKKGTIISFESTLEEKCQSSNLPVKVRLESGREVLAEVAGCTLCYHRFKVGSRVALDEGPNGRLVIQLPAKMTAKQRFDLSMESCSAGCLRNREEKEKAGV